MEEPELVNRIRAGDVASWERLADNYHAPVYRFLRQLTRATAEAEDLTQQVFVRALQKRHTFQGTGTVRSWLFGIAYREFTRWRRQPIRWALLTEPPARRDPFGELHESEALLDALGTLSKPTRAVFLLHYVEDVPLIEISQALGLPLGTVKSRLFSARQQLRQELTAMEEPRVPETC